MTSISLKLKKLKTFYYNPIIVFTMGKVGSRAIVEAIERNGIFPMDLHWLNSTYHTIKDANLFYKNKYRRKIYEIIHNCFLYILMFFQKKKIKVITVFRDPIEVRHSFLFQDLHLFLFDYFGTNKDIVRANSDENFLFKIMNTYLKEYYFKNYLENEVCKIFKLDKNNLDFNKKNGIGYFKSKKYEILFLTQEKMDSNIISIEKFLGIDLEIKRINDSREKWYYPIKNKFQERTKYEELYLRNFYKNNNVNIFYSDEEIEGFIKKWKKYTMGL